MQTGRDRIFAALNHTEPDRIPYDLGGTHVTTIHVQAYRRLCEYLGIDPEPIEFSDIVQQVVRPGRAASPLGPWEKYPHNPVFTPTDNPDSWDSAYLQHPCPVEVNGQWRLYYTGNNGRVYAIGMAIGSRQLVRQRYLNAM